MRTLNILTLIMAGGEGARLSPLTAERSKPSVPFGGRYRLVDFVLSNLINSKNHAIYLLVQYKSQSLIEHIRRSWVVSPMLPDHFVTVVPPQMREGTEWFQGTADAVYQNLNLIRKHDPDLVAIFGADHIYRMDVREMASFHNSMNADVTIATVPVPLDRASAFGILAADSAGRVRDFQEKPAVPRPMPGDPGRAYSSMGNYLFNTGVLIETLREAHSHGGNDFGRHVLPGLVRDKKLFAYDFSTNVVPGVKEYEEPSYWRDVGTIDAYYAANQDVLGIRPRFDLFNPEWPIYSSNYQGPVVCVAGGEIRNSILGAGTTVTGARVSNSVIRREVQLEEEAVIEDCVIMDYVRVRKGCKLRRVIVDRYNDIPEGAAIGFDRAQDSRKYYVSPGGITVLAKASAATRKEMSYFRIQM